MSTNDVINIVKGIKSPPIDYLQQKLVQATQYSDPGVFSAFFVAQMAGAQNKMVMPTFSAIFQEFSVKYLSFVLSTNIAYGFNTTIQHADYNVINSWFLANSNAAGQELFMQYLKQPSVLGAYFSDPATLAVALAAEIGSNDFLTGFLVECDTIGSMLPPKTLLLLLEELDNDGPNFRSVLQAWVVNPRWHDIEGYDTYPWLTTLAPSFAQNAPAYTTINQAVSAACTAHDPPYCYSVNHYTASKGGTITDTTDYARTTYGPTVAAWLANPNGPSKYGLRSAANPNNVITVETGSTGCVIAGTPILMANGSYKLVEQLAEGDSIMSGGGATSVCSSELVVNNQLTQLYSINDDQPFMSFEHAVMTQRGWCSLAPRVSMELTPHHSVTYLTKGDVVWKASSVSNRKIKYEKIVVDRINIRQFEAGQGPVGYDLHVRSGQPSYHANGYCCLVSYPEITSQRITSNILSDMSLTERLEFNQRITEMSPLLEKAFGAPLLNVVKQALQDPHASATRGQHTDPQGRKRRHLRGVANLLVPKFNVTVHGETAPGITPISEMALIRGQLLIDGAIVKSHCHESHVYWHRRLPNGVNEHGAMQLLSHGLHANGVVRQGDLVTPFTADGVVGYNVNYGANKTSWYDFEIRSQRNAQGQQYFSGDLADPTNPAKDADLNKYARVVFSLAQNAQSQTVLHAEITFDPAYCSFGGSPWIAAEIDFTMDYRYFNGSLYPYDVTRPAYRGAAQVLSGACKDLTALQGIQQRLTDQMQKQPLKRSYLSTTQPAGVVTTAVRPALTLAAAIPLSVNALFDSSPPDMANLHELSFGKLKNLMLYALGTENSTYLSWFGETMPSVGTGAALSQPEANLISDPDINSFLVNQFAIGYLTQSFSKSTDDNIKQKFATLANVDDKLNFFWKGDGTTSFAKSKGYNAATANLMDSSYAQVVPLLGDYLNNNPADWAKQLYDFCTTATTLQGLALQNTLDGQQRLTQLCTMLHTLDPIARIAKPNGKSISYATALYERVMDVRVNEVITFSHLANQTDMVEFLTEYFKQYFSSLLQNNVWADAIRSEALQELNDLMKQFQVDNVNDMVAQMGSLIADSVALLTTSMPLAATIQNWINSSSLAQNNPRFGSFLSKGSTLLKAGMTMGVYGYGLYQSISALLDWKDLTPEAKMQAIVTIFNVTVSMFNDIVKFRAAQTLATSGLTMQELIDANNIVMTNFSPDSQVPLRTADSLAGDVEEFDASGLVGSGLAVDGADAAATAARWAKIASITEVFAKGMAVIALAAACVGAGFQIANDFATNQPTVIKVFDILGEVANGVALIVEGIGLVTDFIPIVGVIAAIVGILISFIMMFLHRTPPPTPQEIFVDEKCVPFINGLDMPSADWLAKQPKTPPNEPLLGMAFAFA